MEVYARLMRIHLMIVVYGECIGSRHGNREHHVVESVHGNTQLHAVAVHEVVGWNIKIISGLVVYATGKEVLATVVYLVSLFVGIL